MFINFNVSRQPVVPRRREAVPALLGADREGGGRLLQPHGVLRLRRRVLLALYEGGLRLTLFEVRL